MTEFATFWNGPLHATAYSCLASFPAHGASLRLYSYDLHVDAPNGVEVADAREICPDETLTHRYLAGGRPSLATFSDRFRYSLLGLVDCCWVDADMICLKPPHLAAETIVLGLQPEANGKALVNNAVMKLPADDPVLKEMREQAEAAVDRDLSWGAIGPFLLTEVAERHGHYRLARPPYEFYPIGPDEFWRLLLPRYRDEVAATTTGATMLHLWSELWRRCGLDFSAAPPKGAYLHDLFVQLRTLDRFQRVYTVPELSERLGDWISPAKGPS